MRRVLMVSPHFPPDSSAATHRVRLLAPHLPAAGWRPTVLTVDPSGYEGRLDRDLEALVPATLDVVRASVWPARWTRRAGLGDLGVRAFTGLRRSCRSLLASGEFDLLFITVYPVYPALLGPRLKSEFDIPFVLDYQDPWVGSWGLTVGGAPDGGPDWKSRMTRRVGVWLEPKAVRAADALVAVSQGTIDGIVERMPDASRIPHGVIPLGFEPADFDRMPVGHGSAASFDPHDGFLHFSYVGTLLPTGVETLRLLLTALRRARDTDAAAGRLRLHFFGTSNQSRADRERVMPIAAACGVADAVTEVPERLDYLDALATLRRSSGILLLGGSDPHYTASKLYPALLAKRPLLALFHESSSVVSILRDTASEPSVRVITYGRDVVTEDRVAAVAAHLSALAASCLYRDGDVSFDRASAVSARTLAAQLASVFDRAAA